VTGQELKQLAASGELGPEDLVWHKGMQDWQQASRISGLLPSKPGQRGFPLPQSTTDTATSSGKSSSGDIKLNDEELTKRLNRKSGHESIKRRVVKGGKRLWSRAKHDAQVLKLKHELTALEKRLDGHLQEGGKGLLAGEHEKQCPAELREELEQVTLEIEREEHRLQTLNESRGTGSAKRRRRGELKRLSKERDKILIKIGRHAYKEGSLDEEPTKKITDLNDLISECKNSLEELEPSSEKRLLSAEVRAAVRRRRVRKVVVGGIVACIVLIAFWSLNSFLLQPTLNKRFGPLSDFRHVIPDNTDLVLVMEEDVKDSEWGEEFLRLSELASEASFETLALRVDYSEMVRHVACVSFERSEDSALAGMFSVGEGLTVRFRGETRDNFRSTKYQGEVLRTRPIPRDYEQDKRFPRGQTDWPTPEGIATPKDTSHQLCVCETSWGDLLIGSLENVKSAIDNRAEQRVAKGYEELSRWAGEIPSGQSIWIVFRRLPKELLEDVKIEGGFASLATDDGVVELRAEFTFPDEGEARVFVRFLDNWRDKNEKAIKAYGERLDLAVGILVEDLLNNLERSRDDRQVVITTSTSDRVLAKALKSMGKQSNADSNPRARRLFSG